jgi:zona occludens toxin (predicted ATPase)
MEEKMQKNKMSTSSLPTFSFFEKKKSRFLLLLFVGIIVGSVVKWNVSDYITMGYEDYSIEKSRQTFDYKGMAEAVAKESTTKGEQESDGGVGASGACGI